ncbi:MAG TPA: hypothetical protein VGE02_14120 [Gemmatimonadales bacterium]
METEITSDGIKEERGVRSPGYPLPAAADLLQQVRVGVGMGRASRQNVALAMGFGSLNGRSNRAIGALTHFGLMNRSGPSALQISDLGRRVLMPRDEAERREALAEAAKQPTLYQKLFSRFGGHGLPSLLPNILIREFGVNANTAEDVAKIFRESVEAAGLLRNGILHTELDPVESGPSPSDGEHPIDVQAAVGVPASNPAPVVAATPQDSKASAAAPASGTQRYTIPLDNQGRLATIDIPVPVASSDLRRISRWAQFMLSLDEDDQ